MTSSPASAAGCPHEDAPASPTVRRPRSTYTVNAYDPSSEPAAPAAGPADADTPDTPDASTPPRATAAPGTPEPADLDVDLDLDLAEVPATSPVGRLAATVERLRQEVRAAQ